MRNLRAKDQSSNMSKELEVLRGSQCANPGVNPNALIPEHIFLSKSS